MDDPELIHPEIVDKLRLMFLDGALMQDPVDADKQADKIIFYVRMLPTQVKNGLIFDLIRCMVDAEMDLAAYLQDHLDKSTEDPRE